MPAVQMKTRQAVCTGRGMLFLILAAVVLCSLMGWLVLHIGVDVVQALVALAMMTIVWHLMRRRGHMSIADDFSNW